MATENTSINPQQRSSLLQTTWEELSQPGAYVEEALTLWEPRARATKVDVLVPKVADTNVMTVRAACKISIAGEAWKVRRRLLADRL